MENSEPIFMKDYGVYCCQWKIRKYVDFTNRLSRECHFKPWIINKNQDGMIVNMVPVKPGKVQNLPQKNNIYVL